MQVQAYAKINWALRVIGKRDDGYHDIETLFQTISLHDTLTIARRARLALRCSDASIPADETSLVIRAAKAIGVKVPIVVRLEGTNVEQGQQILRNSGLNFIVADGMKDAAEKVVAATKGK